MPWIKPLKFEERATPFALTLILVGFVRQVREFGVEWSVIKKALENAIATGDEKFDKLRAEDIDIRTFGKDN